MMVALYEPDIPQNTGSLIRLAACLGVGLHIIEPCGFILDDKRLRRAAMDYAVRAEITRHASWLSFLDFRQIQHGGRLVLLTTRAARPYVDFAFEPDDILLLGRESSGVPAQVHDAADARLRVPMKAGARSLNVAQAAAMVLGEGLRQTKGFYE